MKQTPEQLTFTRREFSQMMALFLSLVGVTATAKASTKKRRIPMVTASIHEGPGLVIDVPPDIGWGITRHMHLEEYEEIGIHPDLVSPGFHRQLLAAKAAPYGTPVLFRVYGDPTIILKKARYMEPNEEHEWWRGEDGEVRNFWRIEWEGDGIERIKEDNTSWWQSRLNVPPEFSSRERAWHEQWLKENERYWDGGLAQALMLSTYEHEKPKGFEPWLSNRERKILATFVQWLGTNCGQSFIYEVKRKGGIPG